MSNVLRAAAASVLVSVVAPSVVAQASSPVASSATPVPPNAATRQAYRSAFEGYKGHADQPVGPWQKANDAVGRIGGWQAYAREAAAPAASAATGAASAAERSSSGHGGSHPVTKKP